jgi:competence protein ComEA
VARRPQAGGPSTTRPCPWPAAGGAPNVRRVRTSPRRRDDDDVIRARLRALLAEGPPAAGWVPHQGDDDPGTWGEFDPNGPEGPEEEPDDRRPDDGVALPAGLGRHRAPGHTARLDPGRPGAWAMWVAAVLAAVAVVGWTLVHRPAVDQVTAAVSPTPSAARSSPAAVPTPGPAAGTGSVVVSVVGQVVTPGLVTLPAGSRVADAVAAVGGLLPEADPASVNGAAVLADGQQIAVGIPGAVPPTGGSGSAGTADGGFLVDLNTATVADLDALPGIGPVLAQRIVDHRTAHGRFGSVEQLNDVSGIGPAIFAQLAGRVRV